MKNKAIDTTAKGDYDKGYTGAPTGTGRGSFYPKGGDPVGQAVYNYTHTIYEPTYLKDYQPEQLTGAYAKDNQYKG